jgi:hypothetical protein
MSRDQLVARVAFLEDELAKSCRDAVKTALHNSDLADALRAFDPCNPMLCLRSGERRALVAGRAQS